MKEYLQLFRDQAFNGALALLKRTLISNIVISIILTIVTVVAIVPLILKGMGRTLSDVMAFKTEMESSYKGMGAGEEIIEKLKGFVVDMNYGYLIIAILLALVISAYKYVVFFKLNDNAVRDNNTNIPDALKMSLSGRTMTMIGLYLCLLLIFLGVIIVYALLISLAFTASKILGVLLGFIMFFVVFIFIIRFLVAPAALIHGNMSISDAISYSFKKITWKRAGLLFLMGLVFFIASMIVLAIIGSITGAIFGFDNANTTAFVLSQIISSALSAVLGALIFCAMTAIYFRYSNDSDDESDSVEEHLIS